MEIVDARFAALILMETFATESDDRLTVEQAIAHSFTKNGPYHCKSTDQVLNS